MDIIAIIVFIVLFTIGLYFLLRDEKKSKSSKTLEPLEAIRRNTNIIATTIIIFTILSFLGVIISIVS